MSSYETLSLKGKVVLITGASAGIGEACAHRFAAEGCNIILIARRIAKLEETKKTLEETYEGVKVHCIKFDVKDLDKVRAHCTAHLTQHGKRQQKVLTLLPTLHTLLRCNRLVS